MAATVSGGIIINLIPFLYNPLNVYKATMEDKLLEWKRILKHIYKQYDEEVKKYDKKDIIPTEVEDILYRIDFMAQNVKSMISKPKVIAEMKRLHPQFLSFVYVALISMTTEAKYIYYNMHQNDGLFALPTQNAIKILAERIIFEMHELLEKHGNKLI